MFTSNLVRLRDAAGLSQQQMADKLEIARATYIALETGKKSPTLEDLQKLAEVFEVSLSSFLDAADITSTTNSIADITLEDISSDVQPRETPKDKVEKLREVLLYLLEKVGAKPNVGETVIYKLLYFIDFDYYEKTGKSITGLTYVRNHYGPTPSVTFDRVVKAMQKANELEIVTTKYFAHNQKKYLPVKKPKLEAVSGEELQHIDEVIARLSDKSARELSTISHRDMPWLATDKGDEINYQLAMYRTTETSVSEPKDEL